MNKKYTKNKSFLADEKLAILIWRLANKFNLSEAEVMRRVMNMAVNPLNEEIIHMILSPPSDFYEMPMEHYGD